MKTLSINLSDYDHALLARIAKSEDRRLDDLSYILLAKGLELLFCDSSVDVQKIEEEFTEQELKQRDLNKELAATPGWCNLDLDMRKEKGYKNVSEYLSNRSYDVNASSYVDDLIDPLTEKLLSYAVDVIDDTTEDVEGFES